MTEQEVLAKVYEIVNRMVREYEEDLAGMSIWDEAYESVDSQKYALECLQEELQEVFSN